MREFTEARQAVTPQQESLKMAMARVCEQWPALWPEWRRREFRPVATGISRQMRNWIKQHPETPVSAADIGRVLRFVTSRRGYLRQVTVGASRFGLDGQAAERVTEQEAEWARQQIAVLVSKEAALP